MSTFESLERTLDALRKFCAGYARIHERQSLLNRPWEEDFLHFARDGSLHGHLLSSPDGRRRSVTSDGWCPGPPGPSQAE
jgi:hypothetical protein